ncbi:MAG: hypothetical protein QXR19_02470 [Candidatus Jordarchaeaceae archaeon]
MNIRLLKDEVEYLNLVFDGRVVFIGAVAVFAHLGWKGAHRTTREIDVATTVGEDTVDRLVEEGKINKFYERRKYVYYTPHGVKVDLFFHDVNGIPITEIYSESVLLKVVRNEVRVPRLEHHLVMKYRSGRVQDREDIEILLKRFRRRIDWKLLNAEYPDESRELRALAKIIQ